MSKYPRLEASAHPKEQPSEDPAQTPPLAALTPIKSIRFAQLSIGRAATWVWLRAGRRRNQKRSIESR